ncbi:hypothetical protein TVAG_229350 [Trichomonas vaginalis G3]|uniref:Uncharacterized protein n=1 Tax=Trichomonas vaginalis (strain ATCC PRA-98 / G3) TaxID=412133 RepID=A2FVI8_TRIV3|nr:hypothetical protein TVAGG3_0897820 [Trichomonas vaginalis G3]EAX91065.1 hypothetical protein TVAG_229350 [Trichomonas vaginalis G3]KAI5503203.1 hypothetical protein TVAGG3_0897820 [Trichomonas vaginalis G3]|eukprot:XP_001303995.1 hypothetical protein [Trichomonas vaginalis G3]
MFSRDQIPPIDNLVSNPAEPSTVNVDGNIPRRSSIDIVESLNLKIFLKQSSLSNHAIALKFSFEYTSASLNVKPDFFAEMTLKSIEFVSKLYAMLTSEGNGCPSAVSCSLTTI